MLDPPDTRHLIDDRLYLCRNCSTPLQAHGEGHGRCTQRPCRKYRTPVPLPQPLEADPRLRVLAPHLMTYWHGPAIDELRVYDRAIDLGQPAYLYPYSDACDIAIGDDIGIDVKSFSSPQLLGQALNRSIGGLSRYTRRIVAVSDSVASSSPGYLDRLRGALDANSQQLDIMRVSRLMRELEAMTCP
jgi:hypothetical protein